MKLGKIKKTVVSMCVLGGILFTTLAGGASAATRTFADVLRGNWAHGYVQEVSARNLMQGVSETKFAPHDNLSRAETAAILFRALQGRTAGENDPRQSQFADVSEDSWFAPYVTWAADIGVVRGVSENSFLPNADISRAEVATMLHNLAKSQDFAVIIPAFFSLNQFEDSATIRHWAQDAMRWANFNGILTGKSATELAPNHALTRAEAAAVFLRFLNVEVPPSEGQFITVCSSLYAPFPNAGHVYYLRSWVAPGIPFDLNPETLEMRYVEYERLSVDAVAAMLEEIYQEGRRLFGENDWVRRNINHDLGLLHSGAANAYLFEYVFVDENGVTYVSRALQLIDVRIGSFYAEDPAVWSFIDALRMWILPSRVVR
ncbi:MAG: S-layer homology domain-containing protein [Oscillospiraceae bacterium]|nr:S-layer homology domain-containing protein [Oscillospiraceae bacterium]